MAKEGPAVEIEQEKDKNILAIDSRSYGGVPHQRLSTWEKEVSKARRDGWELFQTHVMISDRDIYIYVAFLTREP